MASLRAATSLVRPIAGGIPVIRPSTSVITTASIAGSNNTHSQSTTTTAWNGRQCRSGVVPGGGWSRLFSGTNRPPVGPKFPSKYFTPYPSIGSTSSSSSSNGDAGVYRRTFSTAKSLAASGRHHPVGFVAPDHAALDELRNSVIDFCRREIPEEVAAQADRSNCFPSGMWRKLGGMGLLGISAEESVGGLAMGYQAHCVVMEELSRASASVALSYAAHSQLCVNQLQLNASPSQKRRFMPDLISGNKVGALAMSESGAGSDVVSMRTTATRTSDRSGWLLNGSKMWITNGPDADIIVVYAKTDPASEPPSRGITAFIVDTRLPGAAEGFACLRKIDKMGMRGSPTGELVFEDVFVPNENVLGEVGRGVRVLMEGLDLERLVLSAGPLGIMQAALDVALPYTHSRRQFGKPVGEFQLVQGRLADMYTKLQASRAYTYETARRVDETGEIRTQDCAGAILYAAERATEVALDCVQVLGGMGYTEDMPASRLLRDAKLYEIGAGTSEVRRMVIGRYFNQQYQTIAI